MEEHMTTAVKRSPWMVRLVYFLHENVREGRDGRSRPPGEFGDLTWLEVYEQFHSHLGDGRPFKTFKGSAEGLRKGNIKDHKEAGTPFLPKYESILGLWVLKSRDDQWADLQQFRDV
jgi:hypothetical protein